MLEDSRLDNWEYCFLFGPCLVLVWSVNTRIAVFLARLTGHIESPRTVDFERHRAQSRKRTTHLLVSNLLINVRANRA